MFTSVKVISYLFSMTYCHIKSSQNYKKCCEFASRSFVNLHLGFFVFQWIDHGYWYDKKDTTKLELLDVFLLTAMSPPGSGRSEISTRLPES